MTRRLVADGCLEIVRRGHDFSARPAPAWRDRRVQGDGRARHRRWARGFPQGEVFMSIRAIASTGAAAATFAPTATSSTSASSAMRLLRDFSKHCAERSAQNEPNDRTFGRRRRHMGVGDFSAQYLNGRRQAMIFRLRGVALFNDQFVAYQPSGNGRYGHTRWLSLAGLGGSEAKALTREAAGVERSARHRHAHCKFIVVAPGRSILLKNSRRLKIANACWKRRAHSQIVHAV